MTDQGSRWPTVRVLGGRARTTILLFAGAGLVLLVIALGLRLVAGPPRQAAGPSPTPSASPSASRRQSGPWREGTPSGADRAIFMGVHQGMIWGLVTDPTTTDDPRLVAYDPALDRWVDHGSVSRNALDVAGSAAILDGRAYLFGHAIGDPDPQLRVWTLDLDSKATSLPGDRVFSDGATAVDRTTGRIYYLTTPGEDAEGHQAPQALRIYDPRLATWRDIAPIPTDRTGALLVADGAGAAYVIGGMAIPICRDDGSGGTACDAPPVVRYDPMTDRWDMVADVPDLAPPWAAVWNEAAGAAVGADGALYLAVLEEAGPIQPGQPFELFRVGIHRLASGARAWTRPYTLPNTGVTSLFATDDGRLVLLGEGQFAASGTMNVPVWVMDLPVT